MTTGSESITVILPIYKESMTLVLSTIKSLSSQTLLPSNIIIIDDAPDFRSACDFRQINRALNNIPTTLIKNQFNIGLANSLNKALQLVQTDFWARIDAGDVNHPDRFRQQWQFLTKNLEYGLVGSQIEDFGNTRLISNFPIDDDILKFGSLFISTIAHPTIFARTNIVSQFKYPNIIYAQDFGYLRQIHTSNIKVANLKEPLVRYRNSARVNKSYKRRQNACLFLQSSGLIYFSSLRDIVSSKQKIELPKYKFIIHTLSALSLIPKIIGNLVLLFGRVRHD